jgi:2-succinyl-6-hydroxy-2,4-cyclohexadiene-1-carboxylate synthase
MPARSDDRLVFLHGFTQTHHHWHRFAHTLVERHQPGATIVLPDLPGHGLSSADPGDIDAAAAELAATTGPATYIGYSMGGRIALHAALAPDSPVERLVLIGATAGLADPAERAERQRLDEERATHLEQIGVDIFLDEWLAAPLFATLPAERYGLEHRRRNTAAGLAHSLRTGGTGYQRPLWDQLGRIEVPVLVLAGSLDTKFTAIGRRLADLIPNATFAPIDSAGHACHTERPDQVADVIGAWLAA